MAIVNNFSHTAKNENHVYQIDGLNTHIEVGALSYLGLSTIYDYSDTLPPPIQGLEKLQLVKQHQSEKIFRLFYLATIGITKLLPAHYPL